MSNGLSTEPLELTPSERFYQAKGGLVGLVDSGRILVPAVHAEEVVAAFHDHTTSQSPEEFRLTALGLDRVFRDRHVLIHRDDTETVHHHLWVLCGLSNEYMSNPDLFS